MSEEPILCPECGKPMTMAPGIDWFCNTTPGCEYKKFRREFEKKQAPKGLAPFDDCDIVAQRVARKYLDSLPDDEHRPGRLMRMIAEAIREQIAIREKRGGAK